MYTAGKQNKLKPHHHIRINRQMKLDLQVWQIFVNSDKIFARSFLDYDEQITASDVGWYTDASRNAKLGCGGICLDEWYSLLWDYDFVKKYQPSIAFLELYGVAIAILLWLCKFKNKRLFLHCDNMSVVYMLNKSTSNCKFCLMLIRLIVLECIKQNCTIQAQHVDMKSNRLADLLSRNKVKTFKAETKRRFKDYSLPIPETLWPMSKIWALA